MNLLLTFAFAGFGAAINKEQKISGLAHYICRSARLRLEETLHLFKFLYLKSQTLIRVSDSGDQKKKGAK